MASQLHLEAGEAQSAFVEAKAKAEAAEQPLGLRLRLRCGKLPGHPKECFLVGFLLHKNNQKAFLWVSGIGKRRERWANYGEESRK